jgi:predicted aspartyl protease
MTVDVMIDGKGPYPFVVDTGTQGTVIARDLADRLGLRRGPRSTIHGMGATEEVNTVIIPNLTVGKVSLKKLVAPALQRVNIGGYGIIGINVLKSRRMHLDFQSGQMTLTPSDDAQDDDWEGETIVVRGRSRLGQLILTGAKIEGDDVVVIIDTGSDTSIGNSALRKRLKARREAKAMERGEPLQMIDVMGNTTAVDYTVVDHLRIANLDFSNLPVAFGDAHMFKVLDLKRTPTLLLAMDALRLFGRVTVDFGTRKVVFDRLPPGVAPGRRQPTAQPVEPTAADTVVPN